MHRPQVWVFGLYDRDTKRVLFLEVPDRKAETLLNVIYKHCHPKSIIYSDCWKAYSRKEELDKDFVHREVNHTYTFVDKTGILFMFFKLI